MGVITFSSSVEPHDWIKRTTCWCRYHLTSIPAISTMKSPSLMPPNYNKKIEKVYYSISEYNSLMRFISYIGQRINFYMGNHNGSITLYMKTETFNFLLVQTAANFMTICRRWTMTMIMGAIVIDGRTLLQTHTTRCGPMTSGRKNGNGT